MIFIQIWHQRRCIWKVRLPCKCAILETAIHLQIWHTIQLIFTLLSSFPLRFAWNSLLFHTYLPNTHCLIKLNTLHNKFTFLFIGFKFLKLHLIQEVIFFLGKRINKFTPHLSLTSVLCPQPMYFVSKVFLRDLYEK